MKKFLKICSINLLLLFFVLILSEIVCYLFAVVNLRITGALIDFVPTSYYYRLKLRDYDFYFDKYIKYAFKTFDRQNYKKTPLVVTGCSYAFGQGL